MTKIPAIISALLLLAACGGKDDPTPNYESQLLKVNSRYDSAIMVRDTAFLKKLYADTYVYTNPEGKLLDRGQQITAVAVSEMRWQNAKSEDVKLKFYDDVAVMTGAFNAQGTYRGNPVTVHERYTALWQRRDTAWVLIAEQGNIVQ